MSGLENVQQKTVSEMPCNPESAHSELGCPLAKGKVVRRGKWSLEHKKKMSKVIFIPC
jgi:hypothetical protein